MGFLFGSSAYWLREKSAIEFPWTFSAEVRTSRSCSRADIRLPHPDRNDAVRELARPHPSRGVLSLAETSSAAPRRERPERIVHAL